MTRSMTGFGRAAGDSNGRVLTVELTAVNHRYLDCSVRTPSAWGALEPVIKLVVRQHVARGKLNATLSCRWSHSSIQTVCLDREIARQYAEASQELAAMLGTHDTLTLSALAQMDGVFYHEEPEEDIAALEAVAVPLVVEALDRLNVMRAAEGKALAEDLRHRVELIREALAAIEARLPELNVLYEGRLRDRIQELTGDLALTEERVAIEVALMADKGDVTEEVVRLKTHLTHFVELLDGEEPVGRRLDFLSQEIQREANTLGVKTRDGNVVRHVIEIKGQLEKIREQVQNIE